MPAGRYVHPSFSALCLTGKRGPLSRLPSAALAAGVAVPGLGLIANPLLPNPDIAGGVALNTLLLAFGLPALLCACLAFLAYLGRFVRPAQLRPAASIAAMRLLFAYVSVEVRRVFQGPDIQLYRRGFLQEEWFACSAAWLALASVVKIFIFDMAGLEGFLRAMPFIGLGAVRIAIGLARQRLIFNKPASTPVQPC